MALYPHHPLMSPNLVPHAFMDGAALRRTMCASGKPFHVDPNTGQPICLCPSLPPVSAGPPVSLASGPAARNSPVHSPVSVHLPPFNPALRMATGYPDHLSGPGLAKDHLTTRSIPIGGPYTPAALAAYHPYLYTGYEAGGMRKAAVRETTGPLKAWLHEHKKNPYPTKAEKVMLAIITQMTLTQVSTWFANARRRLKKESRGSWDGGPDEDKDDDIRYDSDEKDADSTVTDHYENLSDVSVDDDDHHHHSSESAHRDLLSSPTTSAESRLHPHPIPPTTLSPHHHHHHHHYPLFMPAAPLQHSLPLRPEVTSQSKSSTSSSSSSSSSSSARHPTNNTAQAKPKIWSISAIMGLDDREERGGASEEGEDSSGRGRCSSSGEAQVVHVACATRVESPDSEVRHAPREGVFAAESEERKEVTHKTIVFAESESTDSGIGEAEPSSSCSRQGSPVPTSSALSSC